MKKITFLASALLLGGYIVFSSYSRGAGGNGYSCTGGDLSNGNTAGCYQGGCHGSANPATGITVTIELDSTGGKATTHYVGGKAYTIKMSGKNTTATKLPKFGFQIVAIQGAAANASPVDAGTFGSLPTGTKKTAPGSYTMATIIEQSSSTAATSSVGSGANGTTYVVSIPWTAPAKGTGAVSLWAILNAVNGNGNQDSGDAWNTTSTVINEWPAVTTGIAPEPVAMNIRAYPNPFTSAINLDFGTDLQPGKYMVSAYDMSGRKVSTEMVEVNGSGMIQTINTANWAAGLHTVVIENGNQRQHISVIKQ